MSFERNENEIENLSNFEASKQVGLRGINEEIKKCLEKVNAKEEVNNINQAKAL